MHDKVNDEYDDAVGDMVTQRGEYEHAELDNVTVLTVNIGNKSHETAYVCFITWLYNICKAQSFSLSSTSSFVCAIGALFISTRLD